MSSNPARAVTVALVAVAAAIAGLVIFSLLFGPGGHDHAKGSLKSGTLLPKPRPLPDFALVDADGKPYTKDRFKQHWSVVFVGFTHCPDVCPNTLALLKKVHKKLAAQKRDVQIVFLSVDPERDTPPVLDHYVRYFDPGFVGITGPNPELDKLGAGMGFVYAKVPGDTPETYSMDHSALLTVIDPDAAVAAYLSPPFSVDDLVTDLGRLVPVEG